MTRADPGRVLGRALLGWGLGHLALGRTSTGVALLLLEIVWLGLIAWLTLGLADTSAYLVPFLAGVAFLAAWGWQAVAAHHAARRGHAAVAAVGGAPGAAPSRAPGLAIAWLAVPLLAWGAGYWLIAAGAASPSAVLDRFVTDWNAGELDAGEWTADVVGAAARASADLGADADRLRDLRVRVEPVSSGRAVAIAEAVHFERRRSRLLWIFPGTELVPVSDREVLILDLVAQPTELPGGGDVGAVRWEIVEARAP